MECIFVVVGKLGRYAKQSGRVHRCLQAGLEALKAAVAKVYVAVYLVVRYRGHVDVHTGEHAHAGEAGVGGVNLPFIVQLAGAEHIQVLQHGLPHAKLLRTGNGDVADTVFQMGLGRFRKVSQGVVPDAHGKLGLAVGRQGIGLKRIETLGETVVAHCPEVLGGTGCFLVQCDFRQVLPFFEGYVGKVFFKIFLERAVGGDIVVYGTYLVAFSKGHIVGYVNLSSLDFHLAFHLRAKVTVPHQVVLHAIHAFLDFECIVDNRGLPKFVDESSKPGFTFSACAIEHQERVYTEEIGVWFLVYVIGKG